MDRHYIKTILNMTLPATYTCYMLTLAESRGLEAARLLDRTNLTVNEIHQPQARIKIWQQGCIIENLIHLSQDRGIAIEIGLGSNLTKAGLIGYGLMSCATLREAIDLGHRFLPTLVPFLKLDVVIDDILAIVTVREMIPLLNLRHFVIEDFLIEVSQIFRSLLIISPNLNNYDQLELCFDYPEPDYFAAYKDKLPQLFFSQAANQFRFPVTLLDTRIHTANPAMTELIMKQGESEMARLGFIDSWLDRVKALLVCSNGSYPDLPAVAAQLNISERTMKRKLAEQGLSFSALLENICQRDACILLANQALSINEIAVHMGYQDRANFSRAFRRWTGLTPTEYRQKKLNHLA